MKTFKDFKEGKDPHDVIMGVNLGRAPVSDQIRRFRRQIAEQLQGLVDDGELRPDQTLVEVLAILKN